MSTTSLIETIESIEAKATTMKVNTDRVIPAGAFAIGKHVRQGDIYIVRVADDHAHGGPIENRQLAQGTSKGSRHIAEPPATVYEGTTQPAKAMGTVFLGPCVQSDAEFRISHPEHSDVIVPAGTYQIVHQMDARTQKRVQD